MRLSDAGDEAAFFGLRRELFDLDVVARFTIDGEPQSKARARWTAGGTKAYSPTATRKAEEVVGWKFRSASRRQRPDGEHAFGVVALFFHSSSQRRDVDNMLKLILDGLNGVAWVDDSQVTEVSGRKDLVDNADHARTEVLVYTVGAVPRFTRQCEQCGAKYPSYRSQRRVRRFCSQACHLAFRREARVRTCPRCGERFDPKHANRQTYCSDACHREGHTVDLTCVECGKQYARWASQAVGNPLCSPECRAEFWRKRRAVAAKGTCSTCGGSTSKKSYTRCRACVIAGNRPESA